MDILNDLMAKLPVIAEYLGYLTIIATVLVRLTPSPADDQDVKRYSESIWALIDYLPTLGLNPKTKKIKEAYDRVRES